MTDYFGITLFQPIDLIDVSIGPEKLFAAVAGVLFIYINFRGVKETGLAGNLVILIKVTVILVLVTFSLGYIFGNPAKVTGRFCPSLPVTSVASSSRWN